MLSIVIPTYNSQSTIVSCLDSLAQVSRIRLEILIIDNVSSDQTLSLIKTYDSTSLNITCISEPDSGISDAFNKGINLASSDYILLLGSDDCIIPGSMEYVAKHLLDRHDLIDIVFTGIVNPSLDAEYFTDISQVSIKNSFIHPGSFISKKAYDRFGLYSLDFQVGMDYEFFSRALYNGASYVNLRIPTVIHASGGISSNKYLCFKESFAIRRKYYGALLPLYELAHYTPSIALKLFKKLLSSCLIS